MDERPGFRLTARVRDTLVTSAANPDTESSLLLQINVSDPSFSTRNDPTAPSESAHRGRDPRPRRGPAGLRPLDRKCLCRQHAVHVSARPGLTSFVSVIHRIPPEVTAEEAEIPGISKPVLRCGPQHPETGIPVGRPQAYACYDPSGYHPIDDNEHVGAFGEFDMGVQELA